MTQAVATRFRWNPFDLTKVWPHAGFPLIDVGVQARMEVQVQMRMPCHFFQADPDYGARVARRLGIEVPQEMPR